MNGRLILGLGNFGQEELELFVETLDSGDVHSFRRRVYTLESRAERDHVEVGELFEEQSAFESSVDCFDGGGNSVEFLICIASELHERRLHVGLPTGVAFAVCHLCAGEEEVCFDLVGDVPFARIDGAALACCHHNGVVFAYFHRGEVG